MAHNKKTDELAVSLNTDLKNGLTGTQAETLLRKTKYSVTEIAEMSGFGSIRSFNRAFSEHFHLSPTEYRNQKA